MSFQPPLSPSLGGLLGLGDTPRPLAEGESPLHSPASKQSLNPHPSAEGLLWTSQLLNDLCLLYLYQA